MHARQLSSRAHARAAPTPPVSWDDASRATGMRRVQQTAGNRAASSLLDRGRPLPAHLMSKFGRSFGLPLDHVRVHDDIAAVDRFGARALTIGSDVLLAPGEGQGGPDAEALLAHESAHVVQQATAARISDGENGAAESAARAAAGHAMVGAPVSGLGGGVVPAVQAADKTANPLVLPQEYIDMPMALGSAYATERGALRDAEFFWKAYADKFGSQLSPENRQRITGPQFRLPRVDETWVKFHPEHGAYMNDPIEHHHVGQGTRAVPLPERLHDAYTVFHPKRSTLGTPESNKIKTAPPIPSDRTERETRRQIREGRIRGEGISEKTLPEIPAIPPASELAMVPPEELRPVDPVTGKVIGETRHESAGPTLESQGQSDPAHAFALEQQYRALSPDELQARAAASDAMATAEIRRRSGLNEASFAGVLPAESATGAPSPVPTVTTSEQGRASEVPVLTAEKPSSALESLPPVAVEPSKPVEGTAKGSGALQLPEAIPAQRGLKAVVGMPDMQLPTTAMPSGSAGGVKGFVGTAMGAEGGALGAMLNELGISAMQNQQIERAAEAVARLQPDIERLTSEGKWVVVVTVFDYRINLLEAAWREPGDVKNFHRAYLRSGNSYSEAVHGDPAERESNVPTLRAAWPQWPPLPAAEREDRLYAHATWAVRAPVPGTNKDMPSAAQLAPETAVSGVWTTRSGEQEETMTIVASRDRRALDTFYPSAPYAVESSRWDPRMPVVRATLIDRVNPEMVRESRFEAVTPGVMVEQYVIGPRDGRSAPRIGIRFWFSAGQAARYRSPF